MRIIREGRNTELKIKATTVWCRHAISITEYIDIDIDNPRGDEVHIYPRLRNMYNRVIRGRSRHSPVYGNNFATADDVPFLKCHVASRWLHYHFWQKHSCSYCWLSKINRTVQFLNLEPRHGVICSPRVVSVIGERLIRRFRTMTRFSSHFLASPRPHMKNVFF